MSERSRGVFDFLLSSGPAIVFALAISQDRAPAVLFKVFLFRQLAPLYISCNTSAESKHDERRLARSCHRPPPGRRRQR